MMEDANFQDAVNDKVRDAATWAITEHGQRILPQTRPIAAKPFEPSYGGEG